MFSFSVALKIGPKQPFLWIFISIKERGFGGCVLDNTLTMVVASDPWKILEKVWLFRKICFGEVVFYLQGRGGCGPYETARIFITIDSEILLMF
ncbi:MAG: hypothetical protein CFE23_09120 [Flavobacterium sp. BFFFF1]|nr:MAG: hypothetical protein CFE23_09120 [Flavobacterium sp. BFFFF1]